MKTSSWIPTKEVAARRLVHAPCPVLLPVTSAKSKKNGPISTPIANELFENGPIKHEQLFDVADR